MTDKQPPLNQLLIDLLNKHDGVFLGERHIDPALRQTITYLMPQLASENVTTLSLELPPTVVKNLADAPSFKHWERNSNDIAANEAPEDLYNLVQAAKRHGIKVIGHEDEEISQRHFQQSSDKMAAFLQKEKPEMVAETQKAIDDFITNLKPEDYTTEIIDGREAILLTDAASMRLSDIENKFLDDAFDKDPTFKDAYYKHQNENYMPLTVDGLHERNEAAYKIIQNEKQDGKIIVIGGSLHSNRVFDAAHPDAKQTQSDGLDQLMNIPAITVDFRNGAAFDPHIGSVGQTKRVENNHYEAIMPDDIKAMFKKHDMVSWPPPTDIVSPAYRLIDPLPQSVPAKTSPTQDYNPFKR